MVRPRPLTLCAVLLLATFAAPPANATPLSFAGIWSEAFRSMERWLGLETARKPDSAGTVRWIAAPGGCDIDPAGHCKDQPIVVVMPIEKVNADR